MTPLLEALDLTLDGRLDPSDVRVADGELVAVIGPNGSGKTSLLRALADIERSAGDVLVCGEDLHLMPASRRPYMVTYVPASREMVWPISARAAVALGLPRPDRERVDEVMALLELGPFADRPMDRLSTGERARVLLARALAPRPRVLLLDEPLSNLDPYWVLRTLEILRQIVSDGASALVALHDIERLGAFDRALLIDDGKIRADLSPSAMLEARAFSDSFRIAKAETGWRVRRAAG